MKKLISLVLIFATLVLSLMSCSPGKTPADTTTGSTDLEVTTNLTESSGSPSDGEEDLEAPPWVKQPDRSDEPSIRAVTYSTPYADGKMIYYENFDSIESFDNLGWKKISGSGKPWEVDDGKLVAKAGWTVKEQYLIKDSAFMQRIYELSDGYTVQYRVKYTTEESQKDYVAIAVNNSGDRDDLKYDAAISYGGGTVSACIPNFAGNSTGADAKYEYANTSSSNGNGLNAWQLFYPDKTRENDKKLEENDNYSNFHNEGIWLDYRVQVSKTEGLTLYIKKADDSVWTKLVWSDKNLNRWRSDDDAMGVGLVLESCWAHIDEIAIWSGLGEMPEDKSDSQYEAELSDAMMAYYQDFDSVTSYGDLGYTLLDDNNLNTYNATVTNGKLVVSGTTDNREGSGAMVLLKNNAFMKGAYSDPIGYTVQFQLKFVNDLSPKAGIGILVDYSGDPKSEEASYYLANILTAKQSVLQKVVYKSNGKALVTEFSEGSTCDSLWKTFYSDKGGYGVGNTVATQGDTFDVRIQVSRAGGIKILMKKAGDTEWQTLGYITACSDEWREAGSYAGCGIGLMFDKTGAEIDNFAIWTGLGDMPEDHSTSAYETIIGIN